MVFYHTAINFFHFFITKIHLKKGQKSHKHKLTSKINNNKIEEFDHKSPNEIMEDIDTLSDMGEDDFEDNQDGLENDHDHYHSSYEEGKELCIFFSYKT